MKNRKNQNKKVHYTINETTKILLSKIENPTVNLCPMRQIAAILDSYTFEDIRLIRDGLSIIAKGKIEKLL